MSGDRPTSTRIAGFILGVILAATPLAIPVARAGDAGGTIAKPWMRMIVASRPAAGYFELTNASDAAMALTGAESPACSAVMLHRSVMQGGQMVMEMVKSVEIAPHGTVEFAPGGYHLMCMKPTEAVRPGKTVEMTLKFADGTSLTGSFEVRGATGN